MDKVRYDTEMEEFREKYMAYYEEIVDRLNEINAQVVEREVEKKERLKVKPEEKSV